ncbi:ABC transporter ATP-binding protein [Paenibacillus lautus]|uniref:ABC transporter ATP-binding protein n=1 Tax=Paenibacillus lautus TaxID=1401 RepID=UPI002DBD9763|nr:ABC transporter ATP-binding protein [Paenibacillus lautus]MEC0203076.1 ABC transporter ATP-binding protein [Paenibacillus lautus]
MQELLELSGINKRFGKFAVLNNINWSISRAECVAITGSNGAGKSTLLHIIAGLAIPSVGSRVEYESSLRIGYVSERFPALRFRPSEYLRHMASIQGMSKHEAGKRIDAMLNVFQLQDMKMTLCSKGMLQKVNIMQALLRQPDLLVLDEPLSGLDEPSQMEMIGILSEIKRQGTAIVMSVHEPLLIASLADRVTQLRRGRIERDGMLETGSEMGRMKLEFTRVTQDKMLELERRSGFHYWISRGNPASMVVSRQVADEMLLDILQSGGSLTRLEPWSGEMAEQVHPTPGQSMQGEGA